MSLPDIEIVFVFIAATFAVVGLGATVTRRRGCRMVRFVATPISSAHSEAAKSLTLPPSVAELIPIEQPKPVEYGCPTCRKPIPDGRGPHDCDLKICSRCSYCYARNEVVWEDDDVFVQGGPTCPICRRLADVDAETHRHCTDCCHMKRDASGRLHSLSGASVLCANGAAIYAVRGVLVDASWIEGKDSLDPLVALTWPNVEQRRAAAEIIGWGRILEVLAPITLDEDPNPEIGTLLLCDLPGAPHQQFLRVRCGTGREFVLRVSPDVNTAREANAWTYGLRPHEYALEVRA